MRIAVVNDLSLAVEALKKVILSNTEHELAWVAYDGIEAVKKNETDTPDLILMDLIMPNMDGVEATKKIVESKYCPILVVTATVQGNSPKVFAALGNGALDAVKTPELTDTDSVNRILEKIELLKPIIKNNIAKHKPKKEIKEKPGGVGSANKILAICASTGGPHAIVKILSKLPDNYNMPVVIVQHIDQSFVEGFADWLNRQTGLNVKIAEPGEEPKTGNVYVAGKNKHLIFDNYGKLNYTNEGVGAYYKPSIDIFFNSLCENSIDTLAVLLTGMGKDGAEGLKKLKEKGKFTIVQDENSSVVFGMPKAAIENDAACKILPLEDIADEIIKQNYE